MMQIQNIISMPAWYSDPVVLAKRFYGSISAGKYEVVNNSKRTKEGID